MIRARPLLTVAVVALGAAAGGIAWWLDARNTVAPGGEASGGRKVLYWYDPMVPDQHFDRPGKSPFMDMELVPKYADEAAGSGAAVSPATERSIGLRTVAVERGRLGGELVVSGTIAWDLRRERVVSARTDLIVDRLHVKAPFTRVRRGEPLASVIAPAWSGALAEAQAIAESGAGGSRELAEAAGARLRALGIPEGTRLGRDGRIVLTAPAGGVVSEIGAREGEGATAGAVLFRINGTETVWLQAAIPQGEAGGVVAGTPVVVEVGGLAKRFAGRVESRLPSLDAASRTQEARIVLENPAGELAAGQLARVHLQSTAAAETWLVPSDAVIGSGGRARVIVRHEGGHFMPVAVRIGRSGGGRSEVLEGLKGGEQVVVSAQFLLDSEASLSGALRRLGDRNAPAPEAPGHGPHDHGAQDEEAPR